MQAVYGLLPQTSLRKLGADVVDAYLLELVDGNRYVHHLVGVAYGFGYAVEDLAVVHLERYVNSQLAEDPLHDLDKLHLVQERPRPYDIHVTLVELAVAALLRAVGTPYRLYLVTLEWKHYFSLVLNDIAGERHRQVITQPLLAYLRGVAHLLVVETGGVVARVEYLEEELVSLVAVLAEQRREVLHGGRLERREAVGAEDALYGLEYVCAAHHLGGREVARTLGNAWFLNSHFCGVICSPRPAALYFQNLSRKPVIPSVCGTLRGGA